MENFLDEGYGQKSLLNVPATVLEEQKILSAHNMLRNSC